MKADLERLGLPLLEWFEREKRDLPWRKTKDPYAVWVSEIMLQQTRVEAVKEYYRRFLSALPDVESLANCEEDHLLKLWEGLGYYNRVRNMQKAALVIMEKYHGQFPETYEELLQLPGIGSYTAGAVGSIAFGLKQPAVDGNVLRVISRVSDDPSDIASASVKKETEDALRTQMQRMDADPGQINQALMELGALVCLPHGEPSCLCCPWQQYCLSEQHGTIMERPVKSPKKPRRMEKKTVLVISDGEKVLLHRRPDKGLLAGLYEFPNPDEWISDKEAVSFAEKLGLDPLFVRPLEDCVHIFSHVEWRMKGYYIRVAEVEVQSLFSQNAWVAEEKPFSETAAGLRYGVAADLSELENVYALPSAFRVYTKFAKQKIRK